MKLRGYNIWYFEKWWNEKTSATCSPSPKTTLTRSSTKWPKWKLWSSTPKPQESSPSCTRNRNCTKTTSTSSRRFRTSRKSWCTWKVSTSWDPPRITSLCSNNRFRTRISKSTICSSPIPSINASSQNWQKSTPPIESALYRKFT